MSDAEKKTDGRFLRLGSKVLFHKVIVARVQNSSATIFFKCASPPYPPGTGGKSLEWLRKLTLE